MISAIDGELLADVSPEQSRKVLWKIDLFLMPLLGFCYMLQFLDKLSLNYSSILGLLKDVELTGREYSWTASIFYFGYLIWSYPTSYLVVRYPVGKYLSVTVVLWAVVLMCHAACHDFASLMVARFFLGVTEAAVAPGFSLITGMWYQRKEQPLRHGIWFCGNSIASIIGGVASYGIGHLGGALAPWRYLFLIFGAVTAFWGVVMLILLPDNPSNAFWLTKHEKSVAVHRVLDNQTGIINDEYKIHQVVEALKDPKTWLLLLYIFCVNLANGGLTTFGSLVIEGFGYKGLNVFLIQMPAGAAQLGFVILGCGISSYIKNARTLTMFTLTLTSVVGMVVMYATNPAHRSARLAGYCLCMGFAANMPLGLSLITSNVGGFTKKATVNACTFIMYCAGNIVGPQFFSIEQAPMYPSGIKGSLAGFCLGAFWILLMRFYLMRENKRRDEKFGKVVAGERSEEQKMDSAADKTDWENAETFRYAL